MHASITVAYYCNLNDLESTLEVDWMTFMNKRLQLDVVCYITHDFLVCKHIYIYTFALIVVYFKRKNVILMWVFRLCQCHGYLGNHKQ